MSSTDTINCPVCHESIPMEYVICPYDGYSLVKQLREKIKSKIKIREGIGRAIRLIKAPQVNTTIVMDEVVTNADRKGPLIVLFMLAWTFGFQIAPYFNAYYGNSLDIVFVFIIGFLGGFIVALATFLFFLIFWYIITFIIHFASKMLASTSVSGSAAFKETQSVVGYSLVPYLVVMFILNIVLFFILPTNIPQADFITFQTNATLGELVSGVGPGVTAATQMIYLLFFFIASAWSVYICATGLEKLHRVTRLQSFFIPIAVVFIYLFVTYG